MSGGEPALEPLRRRLTLWYAGTFGVILLLLGGGLFLAIRQQYSSQLDASLRHAARELQRAAGIREMEAGARGRVVDAVEELRVPDRTLFLLRTDGTPVTAAEAPPWLRAVARRAAREGVVDDEREVPGEAAVRVHAARFMLPSGTTLVAIAAADRVELEDRFAALIGAFGAAALAALVLVAAGGRLLMRKSTAPIEQSMANMRRFMADAAHELRTPLAVMRGRAEVALHRPRARTDYEDVLRGMHAEAVRLGGIVEHLLTLARADAGGWPIRRARVFLDDIAIDAASAMRDLAATRGVRLDVEEFEEAAVDGDADLLRQLVMILLDNAIKFTPAGGVVTLRVGTEGGRAVLAVADTGCGIAADELPHVFERFRRGDAARTRAAGPATGAGLGLSIARWIADAHHAEIIFQSLLGRGTTVTVRCPAAAPQAAATAGLSSS